MTSKELLAHIDRLRRDRGLLTPAELAALCDRDNVVLDPFSVLVSRNARFGSGNLLEPAVAIVGSGGEIEIGDGNTFFTGARIDASAGGIKIGDGNRLGEGGLTLRVSSAATELIVGDGGRYQGGATVQGPADLGSGSQILGNILAQGVTLAAGGSFLEPNPDKRGAVLKGFGVARGISLGQGRVIAGSGTFSEADAVWQSSNHPPGAPFGRA